MKRIWVLLTLGCLINAGPYKPILGIVQGPSRPINDLGAFKRDIVSTNLDHLIKQAEANNTQVRRVNTKLKEIEEPKLITVKRTYFSLDQRTNVRDGLFMIDVSYLEFKVSNKVNLFNMDYESVVPFSSYAVGVRGNMRTENTYYYVNFNSNF